MRHISNSEETPAARVAPPSTQSRMVEWNFTTPEKYADPFLDLEIDVIFTNQDKSWRVPAFWRGDDMWTVRFAPPEPGEYAYRVESTADDPKLHGREGRLTVTPYVGPNTLLQRGPLRVSTSKRTFEHSDGTPFFWLADTWWMGLSTRLGWDDFRLLTADRKAKGFTVVQFVAGLVPGEEQAPSDPGFCNEGGSVYDVDLRHLNPAYFDYADRRVFHLIESNIVPAIVGAWANSVEPMDVGMMKRHWRYLIARYGAFPVFWVAGGEIYDPPAEGTHTRDPGTWPQPTPGWTEIGRYIKDIDPYRHPMSVEECPPPNDYAFQDETLSDFDMFQPGHSSWKSIAREVGQLNTHYARTEITKPLVVGEIGFENLGGQHLEDFQRVAFWLAALNGAAGRSYGADGVWESYSAELPFHRMKWSMTTWDEGMKFPGSTQVGLGARLIQQYPWWRFEPHPDWITPRGTTLLEPGAGDADFDIEVEWEQRQGTFLLPYAAGIPGEVRMIYLPAFGLMSSFSPPVTVLGLEEGVRYRAYYWDPSLGIRVDLGFVERPRPGATIWSGKSDGFTKQLVPSDDRLLVPNIERTDVIANLEFRSDADAGILLRSRNETNGVVARYSPADQAIWLLDRVNGHDGDRLGLTPVTNVGSEVCLSAEVRAGTAIASLNDGHNSWTTPIVDVATTGSGGSGLLQSESLHLFSAFELRESPVVVTDDNLERKLYDAQGRYLGEMTTGPSDGTEKNGWTSWADYAKSKNLLLDAYRPERLPSSRDWVLVLDAIDRASTLEP